MKLTDKLAGKHTSLHSKLLAGNTIYEGVRMSPHSGGGINYGRPRKPANTITKDALRRRVARTGK